MHDVTFAFRQQAHLLCFGVNLLLFALALMLGVYFKNLWPVLWVGLPTLVFPRLLVHLAGDRLVSRAAYGMSFMIMTALHIHLSHGFIEVHFGVFVLLAILTVYRDWLVILIAALTIAIHHLGFMLLQMQGVPVFLVPDTQLGISIVLIHAVYVVVEAAVLMLICHRSFKEAKVSDALQQTTFQLVNQDGRIELTKRCRELDSDLIKSFNKVLCTLQATVKSIEASATEINEEASVLLQKGEYLTVGMQQNMQEIEQIPTATAVLSEQLELLHQNSVVVLSQSQQTEQSATFGQDLVQASVLEIIELEKELDSSQQKVGVMASAINGIKKVLDVIQDIAEQTNLLALNAAIEAARAGDQGRGFAVVATEVRSLASRTQGSTDEIRAMISELLQVSDESVAAVALSMAQVEKTASRAKESLEVLCAIASQAQQVHHAADAMTCSLMEQKAISCQIAQSAQQLSVLSKEQQVQGDSILESAHHLEQVTDSLAEEAGRFLV